MCWRALAPTSALPKGVHDRYVNQWSGEGGFVISYYIRQGEFINFVCVRQQPGWAEQTWSVPSDVDEMLAAFPKVGPKLHAMMAAASSCSKWGQFTGEHAPQWTKDRVTLLGDSAHAMLATFGQGANMAFEDAYVLAQWLRAEADDPPSALAGYEAVRKPRATRMQQLSRTEVLFKKQHTTWDRLRREYVFLTRHGSTTSGVYRWIFGYDPVAQWSSSGVTSQRVLDKPQPNMAPHKLPARNADGHGGA
jgi:salicylate hydroxylase